MKFAFILLFSVIETVVFACCSGFVLTNVWSWFVVTTLGAPAIGFLPASGISVFLVYSKAYKLRSQKSSGDIADLDIEKVLRDSFKLIVECICYAGVYYAAGYLIHLVV